MEFIGLVGAFQNVLEIANFCQGSMVRSYATKDSEKHQNDTSIWYLGLKVPPIPITW